MRGRHLILTLSLELSGLRLEVTAEEVKSDQSSSEPTGESSRQPIMGRRTLESRDALLGLVPVDRRAIAKSLLAEIMGLA